MAVKLSTTTKGGAGSPAPLLFVLAVVVSISFAGCERGGRQSADAEAATNAAPSSATGKGASAERVPLATFDKKSLTVFDVDNDVRLRQHLARLRSPKITEEALDTLEQRIRASAVDHFIKVNLSTAYLADHQLSIPEPAYNAYYKKLAKTYSVKDVDELKSRLQPEQVKLFDEGIHDVLALQTAAKDIEKNAAITISDAAVDKAIARYESMNKTAATTNAMVYARATNIWHRLQSGNVTFEECATDFTELEQEVGCEGEWGMFSWGQLRSEQPLRKCLKTMKAGDFTPPIECDNGLCIVKLKAVSRTGESPKNPEAPDDDKAGADDEADDYSDCDYELSRIFLRLAVVWEIPAKEEMRQIIYDAELQRKIDAEYKALGAKHKITVKK